MKFVKGDFWVGIIGVVLVLSETLLEWPAIAQVRSRIDEEC